MTKDEEKRLTAAIEDQMHRVRDSGLLIGSKTICGVILKKANDSNKDEHERLQDIINFCEKSLNIVKKEMRLPNA